MPNPGNDDDLSYDHSPPPRSDIRALKPLADRLAGYSRQRIAKSDLGRVGDVDPNAGGFWLAEQITDQFRAIMTLGESGLHGSAAALLRVMAEHVLAFGYLVTDRRPPYRYAGLVATNAQRLNTQVQAMVRWSAPGWDRFATETAELVADPGEVDKRWPGPAKRASSIDAAVRAAADARAHDDSSPFGPGAFAGIYAGPFRAGGLVLHPVAGGRMMAAGLPIYEHAVRMQMITMSLLAKAFRDARGRIGDERLLALSDEYFSITRSPLFRREFDPEPAPAFSARHGRPARDAARRRLLESSEMLAERLIGFARSRPEMVSSEYGDIARFHDPSPMLVEPISEHLAAIMVLGRHDLDAPAHALLRSLTDHVITFCYVSGDPADRFREMRWENDREHARSAEEMEKVTGEALADLDRDLADHYSAIEEEKRSWPDTAGQAAICDREFGPQFAGLSRPGARDHSLEPGVFKRMYEFTYRSTSRYVHPITPLLAATLPAEQSPEWPYMEAALTHLVAMRAWTAPIARHQAVKALMADPEPEWASLTDPDERRAAFEQAVIPYLQRAPVNQRLRSIAAAFQRDEPTNAQAPPRPGAGVLLQPGIPLGSIGVAPKPQSKRQKKKGDPTLRHYRNQRKV